MSGVPSGPPPPFAPTDISNMLLWLSADSVTDSGPGTNVSAATDQSPNGAAIVEGVSGQGPTHLAASGRRGKKLLQWSGSTSTLRSTNAALLALGTGAAKDFTLVWLLQPINTTTTYIGGWGLTSNFNNFCAVRRGNASLLWEITRRDPTNNTTPNLDPTPKGFVPQVLTIEHDATAHTIQAKIDGVAIGSPVAFPWASSAARDIYTIGSLYAQSETKTAYFRLRHHFVFAKKLTPTESQNLHDWCATEIGATGIGLKWKRGFSQSASFGTGSNSTRVIAIVGDSQGCGREPSSTYTSVYAGTGNAAYALFPDGNVDALSSQHLVDPTDVVGGMYADGGAGVTDPWIRMADRLRELGETRNILVVNCCRGGTGSVEWSTSLGASPPAPNTAFGAAYYRIREALQAPGSTLEMVIVNGGVNAAEPPTPAASTVANISIQWRQVIDAFYAKFSAFITKTEWITWARPPATAATTSGYGGNWTAMRTAISDFCAGAADVGMIDDPDGPFIDTDTHLGKGSNTSGSETGLMGIGVRVANARWAAT